MNRIKPPAPGVDVEFHKLRARQLRNDAIHRLFKAGVVSLTGTLFCIGRILARHIRARRNP